MDWRSLSREIAPKLHGNPALADERPIILVNVQKQRLFWLDIETENTREFRVSTAANGIGNRMDSKKTPFGVHRVRQKIGGGEPRGMIFESREATGRVARDYRSSDKDEITSRILWLDGLEPGINRDGPYDTYSRYIYIHGTSDEGRIGEPVSAGCIRMLNTDIIELFDDVLIGDLVVIR